jgi:hypothetical protein
MTYGKIRVIRPWPRLSGNPDICSLPAGPVRQGKEGGPDREGSRSGRYGGGWVARTEQLRAQYTAGKSVRWCEIQTKWRSSVVGERFCEAVLASPRRDRALIVYRLLVRLSF